MRNLKPLIPHIIAVAVFLIVAVIFCKPALESGVILKQGDVTGWQGMSHQSYEYKNIHGHVPLWVTSMFSGMPAYQIAIEGTFHPLHYIDRAFQLWLPKPINFFFLACISFYFMCICFRIRPYAAIAGAIAFAYCSFSPIIITAGHETQMMALAYSPAVIGAVVLLFEKKYISGLVLTMLFTALQINQGHQQVSYYLFLVLAAMTIAYAIRFIKNKEVPHLFKSVGLMVAAGIIGVAVSAITLLTVYDFAKESKRGGQLIMETSDKAHENVKDGKTTGLTKDYAFMWSYGKAETMSLMFPGVMGYGTHIAVREGDQYIFPKLGAKSHVAKFLENKLNVPEDQAENIALQQSTSLYWGDQPFTNGPVYLGAIICFLFLFGMFYLDNKHKWWILSISVIAILLSWGDNFKSFNYFIFDYFPLYNKFRVPTMILLIPQLLFPLLSAMVLSKLADDTSENEWAGFKKGLYATAVMFIIAIGFYATEDFSKENKQRTLAFNSIINSKTPDAEQKLAELNYSQKPLTDNQIYEGIYMSLKDSPDAQKLSREFVSALRQDRASLMLSDLFRSFIFIALAAAAIGLYIRKRYNYNYMVIAVAVLIAIDLLGFGMNYLNKQSFELKDNYTESEFPLSDADRTILADKDPNFRVFNTTRGLDESKTSYYHKSIGGYHPAKLGIYDDLMAYQLSGRPNMAVIDMLNTKYFIIQQGNDIVAQRNPQALGNAWFVNVVKFVKGPVEEMKALDNFNPADTAIVDESFKNVIKNYVPKDNDSTASIIMTNFDNDAITYKSHSLAPHVAIFSEVYYKDWNAYIDGKKVDYFKANYVLRGLEIPAGDHVIEFKFEPTIYYAGDKISAASGWLVFLVTIAWAVYMFLKYRKRNA